MLWIGSPAMAGGILGVLGAIFGVWGGCKINHCGICAAAVLLGIASGTIILAALGASAWASVFGHLCDDFSCGSCVHWYQGDSDVCCAGYGDAICKETKDWACDMVAKKLFTLLFAFVGSIVALFASACSCGAVCCCPQSFEELAAQTPGHGGGQQVVGQVVGQPVSTGQECNPEQVGGKS